MKDILDYAQKLRNLQEKTLGNKTVSSFNSTFTFHTSPSQTEPTSPLGPLESQPMAMHRSQTLKELAGPTLDQQPLCIDTPQLEVAFEFKSGMICLLPTFHRLSGEDLNKHLKEFHVVCSSVKPLGI